jgi:hypothetical protein
MRLMPLVATAALAACSANEVKLAMSSDQVLRARPHGAPQSSPAHDPILIVALDGMSRDLLYDMLRRGELPNTAALLGGDGLAHAYLAPNVLSTLPSLSLPAWVSAMTGYTPAEHGVAGNEYFIRERRELAAPSPISFHDTNATLSVYTDHYVDKLIEVPTVYERLREREPAIEIWVMANHVFRGADRLMIATPFAFVTDLQRLIQHELERAFVDHPTMTLYRMIDTAAIDDTLEHLENDALPDVLTLYVSGTDLYAHVAVEGPDEARRMYMMRVVDPQLGRVAKVLRAKRRLDRAWVIVLADHGHTPVLRDKQHSLGAGDGPPTVLRQAGFRVRPFKREVDAKDRFSAVLAYGGPFAYLYVADRSRCTPVCDWARPPRYEEDVLPAADAFFRANQDGSGYPGLRGTLDMVLVRRPRPWAQDDLPFEVYVGNGRTRTLEDYLRDHPHPTYVDFVRRMHDLAVGLRGERAGDVILLAHDGDVANVDGRFYFAGLYRSFHGSPSRADSEIPLIVANRRYPAATIGRWVDRTLGDRPYIERLTDLLLDLRAGAFGD